MPGSRQRATATPCPSHPSAFPADAAGSSGAGSSSGAGGSGSSSAAAAAEPAGMRMYLSQIREWVVDFGADMLFISIRTDVAWWVGWGREEGGLVARRAPSCQAASSKVAPALCLHLRLQHGLEPATGRGTLLAPGFPTDTSLPHQVFAWPAAGTACPCPPPSTPPGLACRSSAPAWPSRCCSCCRWRPAPPSSPSMTWSRSWRRRRRPPPPSCPRRCCAAQ